MRILAIGLFAAVLASPVHARPGKAPPVPKPPADLIPYGADWSCFHAVDPAASGTETPRCERTEAACKATRRTLADPSKMTPCETQAHATVVIYFDPKRTSWRFLASPDDDGCLALRSGLISARSYQLVAQCEEVGKRLPPAAKLETTVITPGKAWWCLDLPAPSPRGARPACMRTVAACEEAIRRDAIPSTKCVERTSAFLVTFKDSTGALGFAASTTSDACTAYRERVITAAFSVSGCAQIGNVARAKLDRTRVPRGRNWMCFVGADPNHPIGSCARTASDCAAQHELNRYVLGASPGCKTQSAAVARNILEQVFLFPSMALCEAHISEHPDGSRCEAVN